MNTRPLFAPGFLAIALCLSCAGTGPSYEERVEAARPAVAELQAGNFESAEKAARAVLQDDEGNSQARLVAAITRYKRAVHDLVTHIQANALAILVNHEYIRNGLEKLDAELEKVDQDLDAQGRDA